VVDDTADDTADTVASDHHVGDAIGEADPRDTAVACDIAAPVGEADRVDDDVHGDDVEVCEAA